MQDQFARKQSAEGFAVGARTTIQRLFVRTLADAITYFVASLGGFGCLLIAYRLLGNVSSPDKITGGLATALIFLAIFGLLGSTGKLPDVYLEIVKKAL